MSVPSASLAARVAVTRGDFRLDVDLAVGPGEVVAVLGPNGSGKSTLMGAVAGLLAPDVGVVRLGERTLTDVAAKVHVRPHRRRIGLLAQQPLLFPHLSAVENVAFGPRAAGARRRPARESARSRLAEVDALDLADRRPGELSGGQAARVALARALAPEPEALLLDEPLAAVDVDSTPALRALLRRLLGPRAALVVTHDVLDALVLADRVLVLAGGRVVEQGPAAEVLRRPRSAFAARLAGLNLLSGTASAGGLRTEAGIDLAGAVTATPGEPAVAVFPPSAVAVHTSRPGGSPRAVLAERVSGLEPREDLVRVRAGSGLAADITPSAVAELGLAPGDDVWFVVKAAEIAVHPVRSAPAPRGDPSHA